MKFTARFIERCESKVACLLN